MKAFNDEEKIDKLLESKSFSELSEEERTFVLKILGSEEQYHAMRRVTLALITSKVDLSPDPKTLRSLETKMQQGKRFSFFDLLNFRIPAYVVLLMIGIAVAIVMVMNPKRKVSPDIVQVIKRDTVLVSRVEIDTVFRDRIIYRQVSAELPTDRNYLRVVKKIVPDEVKAETGVSMKDKQELETLLVSGSE